MTADLFGHERAAPSRRAQEPTVRTDARQVDMFGSNDAAIQAQAARDAAGPRGGQQRPGGLFEPSEPTQEGLLP